MKIKLNENYVLNSDSWNVWITQVTPKKNGVGYYERVFNGYHANIRNCLLSFVSMAVNTSGAKDILELTERIEQVENDIKEFCQSITVNIRKIPTEKKSKV